MGLTKEIEAKPDDIDLTNRRLHSYTMLERAIKEIRQLAQKKLNGPNAAYYKWLDDQFNILKERLHACVSQNRNVYQITSPDELDKLTSPKQALIFFLQPPTYHVGDTYDELVIRDPTRYTKDTLHSIMWGMLNGLRGTFFSALVGLLIGMLFVMACLTPPVAGAAFAISIAVPIACCLAVFIGFGAVEGYKASKELQKVEVEDLSPAHLKELSNNSLINRIGLYKTNELAPLNARCLETMPVLPNM